MAKQKKFNSKDFQTIVVVVMKSDNTPLVKYLNPDGWREP